MISTSSSLLLLIRVPSGLQARNGYFIEIIKPISIIFYLLLQIKLFFHNTPLLIHNALVPSVQYTFYFYIVQLIFQNCLPVVLIRCALLLAVNLTSHLKPCSFRLFNRIDANFIPSVLINWDLRIIKHAVLFRAFHFDIFSFQLKRFEMHDTKSWIVNCTRDWIDLVAHSFAEVS